MQKQPIALVIPWYGDQIQGGAERECNYLAHSLTNAGQPVEVFTTCVKDAGSDRGINTIKPGVYAESGIIVRRFPVREHRDSERYMESDHRIFLNKFTREDEEIYLREDINSEEMYAYIREKKDAYRAFVFIPYLYGITFNGPFCCSEKSVMIPCLHDEGYAYMSLLKPRMNALRGMIFHSKPEEALAKRLYGLENVKTATLGEGVDTEWSKSCSGESFRKKYRISQDFILYAGRKDSGKKVDELIRFFLRYKKEANNKDLKLVLIGGGPLPIELPPEYRVDIIDLGFVPLEDKQNAFAACTILCNPSHFESFSLVIMEGWLAKRPVLVSGLCLVTANFARETNGGLWYQNYAEFRECLNYLLNNRDVCSAMGENGFQYVMEHFTHEKIAENYLSFIESCGL